MIDKFNFIKQLQPFKISLNFINMTAPFDKYNFFKLSIIDDNIDNVFKDLHLILTEKGKELISYNLNYLDFNLICEGVELDYNGQEKFLIFEPITNSDKTVFFTNLSDGWNTLIYSYANRFKKEIYQGGFSKGEKTEVHPAYFFTNYSFNDNDELQERVIHLIKENTWTFYENSDKVKPLPYENVENYRLKRKTDRLSNEIILNYLREAGYDLRNTDFFKTEKPVIYFKRN